MDKRKSNEKERGSKKTLVRNEQKEEESVEPMNVHMERWRKRTRGPVQLKQGAARWQV